VTHPLSPRDGAFETPAELPTTCGFCYPDLDYDTYVHLACAAHAPDLKGADDEIAKRLFGTQYVSGTGEAGGHGNQDFCESIHQQRRDP
jgi:hypothetical protein